MNNKQMVSPMEAGLAEFLRGKMRRLRASYTLAFEAGWIARGSAAQPQGEIETLRAALRTEVEAGDSWRREALELRGLTPAFPPRPPNGDGMPRYGLRWNGPQQPLAVAMSDGYWTPWHLAERRVEVLEQRLKTAEERMDAPAVDPGSEEFSHLSTIELKGYHLGWSAAMRQKASPVGKPAHQPHGEQFTYSSKQATNCAGCGLRKHTPLRVDDMGGYVCLTCIDKKLDELLAAEQLQGAPMYIVRSHGSCCWEEISGESLEMCQAQPGDYEVRELYTRIRATSTEAEA